MAHTTPTTDQIAAAREYGMTVNEIADHFGISHRVATSLLAECYDDVAASVAKATTTLVRRIAVAGGSSLVALTLTAILTSL